MAYLIIGYLSVGIGLYCWASWTMKDWNHSWDDWYTAAVNWPVMLYRASKDDKF